MAKSKLRIILESLDIKDLKRLKKFLSSPYFNESPSLTRLFELHKDSINKANEEEPDKVKVWKDIFKDEQFDDVRFRKLNSDLLKLVEGYLSQVEFENNTFQKSLHLMQAIENRNLKKLLNTTLSNVKKISESQPNRSSEYHFFQYAVEKNIYRLTDFETKRETKSNIEDIIKNLDFFYLSEKLRLYSSLLSRKGFIKHDYNILFIDEIIDHLRKNPYDEIPNIQAFFLVIKLLTDPTDEASFFELKRLVFENTNNFSAEEIVEIFTHARNFCIRKANQGAKRFEIELFELYKKGLEIKIIMTKNELSPWDYKNIVAIGLRLNEFAWTKDFIERYKESLPIEYRTNAYNLEIARLHWRMKEYEKVIESLRDVEFIDLTYNLNARAMMAIAYYELDYIEALLSTLENYKVYVSRHKDIDDQRKRNNLNFIKYMRKLIKVIPGDHQAIEKIRIELENEKEITDQKWLREKLNELES
jgi:hypothetical protein